MKSLGSRLERIEKAKKKGRVLFKTPGRFTDDGKDIWFCDGKIIPEPELREDDHVFIEDLNSVDEEIKEKFKQRVIEKIEDGAEFPEETTEQVQRKERILRKIEQDREREHV